MKKSNNIVEYVSMSAENMKSCLDDVPKNDDIWFISYFCGRYFL